MTLLLSWFFSSWHICCVLRSFSLLHFCQTGSFGVIGFFSPKKWNHHLKTFFFKFAFTHKCDKYAKNVDGDECFSQHCTLLFLNSRFSELKSISSQHMLSVVLFWTCFHCDPKWWCFFSTDDGLQNGSGQHRNSQGKHPALMELQELYDILGLFCKCT